MLNNPSAEQARVYLEKRKVSLQTIKNFQLGYAPDRQEWLYNFLKKNNYSDDILKKVDYLVKIMKKCHYLEIESCFQ